MSDIECLDWLPFNVKLEEQDVFLGKPDGVGAFTGLTYSDFFFREVLRLPVITEIPGDGRMDGGGFVAFVPYGKGQVVLCQLYPAWFHNAWQRTKVLRIFSGLLRECGVEWAGLTESPDGDLEGIWYYDSALDFNPDMHRSW